MTLHWLLRPGTTANDDDADTGNDVLDAGSAYVIGTSGWAKIPDDDAGNRYHEVTGLTNDITYMFAVRAVNPSGDGPASTATGVPVPVPAAPVNLSATPGDGEVALSWDDPGNATIIKIPVQHRRGANFSDFDGGSSASTTSYTITGLDNGVTYTLALRAVNPTGNGEASTVTALILPAKPKLSAAPGDGQVVLSWDDPGNPTIDEYQLSQITPPREWLPPEAPEGMTTSSGWPRRHTVTPRWLGRCRLMTAVLHSRSRACCLRIHLEFASPGVDQERQR